MKNLLPKPLLLIFCFFLLAVSCEKKEDHFAKQTTFFNITSILPDSAYEGELVSIIGEGFHPAPAENKVQFFGKADAFNKADALVKSATDTSLIVVVPKEGISGKVTVTINGYTKTSKQDFKVFHLPVIHELSVYEGYDGQIVELRGGYFSETPGENIVKFNGTPVEEYRGGNHNQLFVRVPAGATTGKVSVTVNGKTAYSAMDFILKPDYWTLKKDPPVTKQHLGIGFSIGNKGYAGIGHGEGGRTNSFWEYDPSTDSWTQKANLPAALRNSAIGFAIGDKGYVGTGITENSVTNDFWEYDPATDSWTQKADLPGVARYGAVGFSIEGKGFVGTGRTENISEGLVDFWEYNPATDSWRQKADFPGGKRWFAGGFAIGNKGYLGTGNDDSDYYNDFWEYDPSTDTWTQKANVSGDPRIQAAAFSIENKGYIGLGRTNAKSVIPGEFYRYDPAADEWVRVNKIRELFYAGPAGVSFAIGNKGYTGMGVGTEPNKIFWEYSLE